MVVVFFTVLLAIGAVFDNEALDVFLMTVVLLNGNFFVIVDEIGFLVPTVLNKGFAAVAVAGDFN